MRDTDFERVYAEHAEALLRFLVYRTGDAALSEDLLADTFERVLTSRRGFDRRRGGEKTWIYAIALNLVRDGVRRDDAGSRAYGRVAAGQSVFTADDPFERVETRDALRQAMSVLSDVELEVVSLRYGSDLTVPDIARVTHVNLATAEGRLYRALRKMRKELG